jgi:F-type H+-transporting ATPase subunit b
MNINVSLIFQMIAFLAFVFLTKAYIWPPVMAAMEKRAKKIADGLAAAEAGTRKLEEAKGEIQAVMKQAREQATELLAAANKRSVEMVEESKAQARVEGERLVTAARAQIQQEVGQAREALRREVAILAVAGAKQILGREIDAKTHAELLDRVAKQLN